jgi:hypothetical protein
VACGFTRVQDMIHPSRIEDRLHTVEEYSALDAATEDARYEYVGGRVYMLAGATRMHARS